jgi:hypothetical protein
MGPQVSVIMPVYNGGAQLGRAIDSILQQTFDDFELVIVDDGSTDDTPTVLRRMSSADQRVRIICGRHAGLVAALNEGCANARGTYLARMDADDVAMPDRLGAQVRQMAANPRLGVLGGAVTVVDASDRVLYQMRYPTRDSAIRKTLPTDCPFAHPAVMMRRSVFERTGGYRPAFVHAEDYDLWLRIAEHCEMANLDRSVLRYQVHTSQTSVAHGQQQIVSTIGAQVAAQLRRTAGDGHLAQQEKITLDAIQNAIGDRQMVLRLLVEACAARALFLALVGDAASAIDLIQWGLQSAGEVHLGGRARAKADIALATALYRRGRSRDALRLGAHAAVSDPVHVFRTACKGVSAAMHAALHPAA